ncbi:adenosylcobinamide amidohydrolase [Rhodobacteraceae bacterium KMM 6894]|nr:adenosylcobinamide amidohydrolase [Rhodobacteraceae bacterium KMM 6894]
MTGLTLTRPWLEFDLGGPMSVLSWAINRPGRVTARRILWREVRNADLPADLDVDAWLQGELRARDALDAVTFLTSRHITCYHSATAQVGDVQAHAVATVGLSNAERVGQRIDRTGHDWGTINIALRLNIGLNEAAQLETLSMVVAARTAAVMDAKFDLPGGVATGTGTDCIAIAAPEGNTRYAGMHTPVGEATGRAVYDAVSAGASEWMTTVRRDL